MLHLQKHEVVTCLTPVFTTSMKIRIQIVFL